MIPVFKNLLVHTAICLSLTVSLAACSKSNDKRATNSAALSGKIDVITVSTLLATIADNEKPADKKADDKHSKNPEILQQQNSRRDSSDIHIEMVRNGRGNAYIASVNGKVHVVHNGTAGAFYDDVDPYTLAISPDGQRVAYGVISGDKRVMVIDGVESGYFDDLGPPIFSPDSKVVAFEGKSANQWYIHAGKHRSAAADSYNDKPAFSPDSKQIVFYENASKNRKARLVISDLSFTKPIYKDVYGATLFSNDNSRVALVQEAGDKKKLVQFSLTQPEVVTEGPLYDVISERSFSSDGSVVAYIAKKGDISYIVSNGREERLPAGSYPWPPVINPDKKTVGVAVAAHDGAYFYQAFLKKTPPAGRYKEIADIAYSADGRQYTYVAIKNERFHIVLNGKDGPSFDRVISPMFSPDGRYLVYRARQSGTRFVVVVDTLSGNIIKKHPGYERVFETVFTPDGKSVAYGVVDKKQIMWKVEKL